MNQIMAQAIHALPWWLRNTYILGWLYLVLCCLGYIFFLRPTLWRIIRSRVSDRRLREALSTPSSCLFFDSIQKEAHLWDNGWFTINRILLPLLPTIICLHGAASLLTLLLPSSPALLQTFDTLLLSLFFFLMAILLFMTQPIATIDRRKKWGFRTLGNIVHAVLWEAVIVALLFLWLYITYFFVLL